MAAVLPSTPKYPPSSLESPAGPPQPLNNPFGRKAILGERPEISSTEGFHLSIIPRVGGLSWPTGSLDPPSFILSLRSGRDLVQFFLMPFKVNHALTLRHLRLDRPSHFNHLPRKRRDSSEGQKKSHFELAFFSSPCFFVTQASQDFPNAVSSPEKMIETTSSYPTIRIPGLPVGKSSK